MAEKLLARKSKRPVKNLNIEEFKAHINYLLAMDFTQEEKRAYCQVLDNVLYATNNYNGWNYRAWIFGGNNSGFNQWRRDGQPEDNKPYLGLEYDRYYY